LAFSQNSPGVRWEYTGFEGDFSKASDRARANQLGAEGWELVTRDYGCLYFKRRLP